MFKKKKISVVLPCYNEEESILKVINDFFDTNYVDEIIAVDNNSTDKTKDIIHSTKAKYVRENIQGYGAAIKRGMKSSSGDLIVVCEPDGSFSPDDLLKMLPHTNYYDCVFGTRTNKKYIESGAKMNFSLRLGNIIVAKLISFLFRTQNFSDVGCTFKILSKKSYELIKDKLTINGSELSPEIMLNLILKKQSIIEIPVAYKKRSGYSKITKNFIATSIVAIKMIILILKKRLITILNK